METCYEKFGIGGEKTFKTFSLPQQLYRKLPRAERNPSRKEKKKVQDLEMESIE